MPTCAYDSILPAVSMLGPSVQKPFGILLTLLPFGCTSAL